MTTQNKLHTIYLLFFFIFTSILACSKDHPAPTGTSTSLVLSTSEVVERYSDLCHFDFSDDSFSSAKRLSTHQWAKDRYEDGLEIKWDIRDRNVRESPVMRQALNLVADTLYALVLPTNGIHTLEVFVDLADLSDGDYGWTTAQGGGDFYTSGSKRGLPVSGSVGITIDDYELEDTYNKPRYISSLAHWYTLMLHEALHVLGFGISPKWEDMITTRRFDDFVCGLEVWRGHWYSPSYGGVGRLLMFTYIYSSRVHIAPETLCALEDIGWDIRQKGEGVRQTSQSDTQSDQTAGPDKPTNLQVGSITATSARVSWNASVGANDYDVAYKTATGGKWVTVTHRGIALHNTLTGLEPNTKYNWAVKADNDDGKSDWAYGPQFITKQE